MITPAQEKYLGTLSDEEIVRIKLFDPRAREEGFKICEEVGKILSRSSLHYIGSSRLGIAGENDIDISIVSSGSFDDELESLKRLYGEPTSFKPQRNWAEWKFKRNGFPVELYLNGTLSPLLAEQIKTHEVLLQSPALAKEYEQLKLGAEGMKRREYMRKKYEFFNKIYGAAPTQAKQDSLT
ncbi:MAG: GrpB family protein [bacterium]